MKINDPAQPIWTSRFFFLMASIGFAVGLGNIWRFPYVAGESGGGAFVLLYLLFAFGIGIPIVIAELLIGKRGRAGSVGSMRALVKRDSLSSLWVGIGYLNQVAALLIQVTYAVIAGWVLFYFSKALTEGFVQITPSLAAAEYGAVKKNFLASLFWTSSSIFICGLVLYFGLKSGIERAVGFMMPTLFFVMVLLIIFNIFVGGFKDALIWLFEPDFSKITPQVCLAALAQAFFSIGVAMAVMMTYGSFLPQETNIFSSAFIIVFADTLVAILAGLVIFPVVFSGNLDPAAGPGLIFQVLPVAFAGMPGGYFFGVLFFLLLSVAAITSMLGLLESLVRWVEIEFGSSRKKATTYVIFLNMVLSSLSVAAYSGIVNWGNFYSSFNDRIDYVSNQVLLPLGGMLIAVFVGWFINLKTVHEDYAVVDNRVFTIWKFFLRWPVPFAVFLILVTGMLPA
ncbi:MAG: sodium-dependent transporter [Pseudomonadota bacterium]|nr:sodium-dependent transporter [Pseudomonadota bacterium]